MSKDGQNILRFFLGVYLKVIYNKIHNEMFILLKKIISIFNVILVYVLNPDGLIL